MCGCPVDTRFFIERGELMLSIIIPCYNEGEKIKENAMKIKREFPSAEIICVNDGSSDCTAAVLGELKETGIHNISFEHNKGKGGAVKAGILASNGSEVCFMDADLSTALTGLTEAHRGILEGYDVVIGSRTHKDSVVSGKTPLRSAASYVSNLIVRILTGMKYRDTQCGFKMFTRDAAMLLAKNQKVNGWAFDVEYLYMAKKHKLKVKEIPVVWSDDRDSRVNIFKDSIKFFVETVKIVRAD